MIITKFLWTTMFHVCMLTCFNYEIYRQEGHIWWIIKNQNHFLNEDDQHTISPFNFSACSVQRDPCWSDRAQNNGAGRNINSTFSKICTSLMNSCCEGNNNTLFRIYSVYDNFLNWWTGYNLFLHLMQDVWGWACLLQTYYCLHSTASVPFCPNYPSSSTFHTCQTKWETYSTSIALTEVFFWNNMHSYDSNTMMTEKKNF